MTQLTQRTPGISGLDHAVIAVHDLDLARETYRRMGFTLAPRGLHSTGSTNHNIMLGRDYLELLHVPRTNPLQAYFHEFLARHEGLAALALTGTDAVASNAALAQLGFEPQPAQDFSRPVTKGSKTGVARFRLTNLPVRTTPGAQVFLCQHFSRELVWLPELQSHANTATGIAAVAFVADNVAYLAGVYGKLFGAWPQRIDEGVKVDTGRASLAFCTRQALQTRLREVALPLRAAPYPAALFIKVADRQKAYQAMRDGGFTPARLADGAYAIDAADAHGVVLVFG